MWFCYLGANAFVTPVNARDIDSFSLEAATQLRIIRVSATTISFFFVGTGLITLVYFYVHVFLEKLWRTIGTLPERLQSAPISDSAHP